MTIPAPVYTLTPTTVNRTYADLAPTVTMGDTNTPSPASTSRSWEFDAVNVKTTLGANGAGVSTGVTYGVNLAAGTRVGRVRTTNTDGTGTSNTINLTVTDAVTTQYTTPTYVENNGNVVRFLPDKLPIEYQDPTLATPGLPTASGVYNARTRGTIS